MAVIPAGELIEEIDDRFEAFRLVDEMRALTRDLTFFVLAENAAVNDEDPGPWPFQEAGARRQGFETRAEPARRTSKMTAATLRERMI